MTLELSDPGEAPIARSSVGKALEARIGGWLHDRRDVVFVRLAVTIGLVVGPASVALFVVGRFSWWWALAYWGVVLGFFLGPYILMLHNTSHRTLFTQRFKALNRFIPLVLGPFFGETPETYFAHHVGMHHPENNLEDDLSSTLRYQRDSVWGFLHYFFRFFLFGLFELSLYFYRRKRYGLMRRAIVGELSYFVAVALLVAWRWQPAVTVFVVPFVFARFAMMAGNWGQHAFVDPRAPENCYRNSITCINSGYNRRCFNDGYHIGHHLKATRHWTEMPAEFAQNRQRYADEGAIVFQGVDFFMVWAMLMLKRYDWLARCAVSLEEPARSPAEWQTLLRSRTQRVVRSQEPSALAGAATA